MLCIHTDNSNKPSIIVDELGASTSHVFDFELNSLFIEPVIIDPACLDNSKNSCFNDCVMPKSKESETQGTFVPTCHNCGKIGHIRSNCYLLKSHEP